MTIEKQAFEAGKNRPGENWLYIWGEVRYDDGFGVNRFTKFCHRYHLRASASGDRIKAKHARYHIYGNDAD
jgi:hypothetical protein